MLRSYSEALQYKTFSDRFDYLKLYQHISAITFGDYRIENQRFYKSKDWQRTRDAIISRDLYGGHVCDLGIPNVIIHGKILIHHINPITLEDILEGNPIVFDHENLICTSLETHNFLHFGRSKKKELDYQPRRPGDTNLW